MQNLAEPATAPGIVDALRKRRKAAEREKASIQPLLDDCYRFAIPYRKGVGRTGKGEERSDQVFDHTAVTSTLRFAGKLANDLVPPGFFKLEPGPLFEAAAPPDAVKEFRQKLETYSSIVGTAFLTGEFDTAFAEMATDLYASTGFMLMPEGDRDRPIRFCAVPADEMLLEGGPYGVTGMFWTRKWTIRSLREAFPSARFGQKLAERERVSPEDEINVSQDTIHEPHAKKQWRFVVHVDGEDAPIFESRSVTCPWLTPRYMRVPGETWGRGVLMLAMPTIRTVNTAAKLTLQSAAIALLGIYTAVDDGVFNVDQSPLEPGSVWKVARNGGMLGPSVTRFPDPRIDLSNIVLQDLRQQIQAVLVDQALPPDAGAVRSATEVAERIKRLASDHVGAFGRLVAEIVIPLVRRAIECFYNQRLIDTDIPIDQLLIRVNVVSPLARARQATEIQPLLEFLQLMSVAAPALIPNLLKMEDALIDAARKMGVAERFLTTSEERAAMAAQAQEAAQAQMMIQAAPAVAQTVQAAAQADATMQAAPQQELSPEVEA